MGTFLNRKLNVYSRMQLSNCENSCDSSDNASHFHHRTANGHVSFMMQFFRTKARVVILYLLETALPESTSDVQGS